jgi:hypothetical protein
MDQWQRVEQLFDAVLQHSPEERQELPEQECGPNQDCASPAVFMARPAIAGMAEALKLLRALRTWRTITP